MSIQEHLGSVPEPYSDFHIEHRYADSYSRMLDHEVAEWEQPYGYNIKPMEPEAFEKYEHSFDVRRKD